MFGEGAIDDRLTRFVERRRRLVKEQPVGLRQQRARHRETLLLAAGQARGPVVFVVEPVEQQRQTHRL